MTDDSELGPARAGFRFVREILAITSWAIVGWNLAGGVLRWVLVLGLPLLAATLPRVRWLLRQRT